MQMRGACITLKLRVRKLFRVDIFHTEIMPQFHKVKGAYNHQKMTVF